MPGIKSRHIPWIEQSIKTHNSDECLLWPFAKGKGGYGHLKYEGRFVDVHRLAFFLANGRWADPETRHTCDIRLCFNPRHLIEGTRIQNAADAVARQRTSRGTDRPESKLNEHLVRKMRAERPSFTYRELGDRYGVCEMVAYAVVNRRTWRHVE
jgi:hypothetical protein